MRVNQKILNEFPSQKGNNITVNRMLFAEILSKVIIARDADREESERFNRDFAVSDATSKLL